MLEGGQDGSPLLMILRNGCSDAFILNNRACREWAYALMPNLREVDDACLPGQIRETLVKASESHLLENAYVSVALIRKILGITESTNKRRFVTAANIREMIKAEKRVGDRRANMILRNEIEPAVAQALAKYLSNGPTATVTSWSDCELRITARPIGDSVTSFILRVETVFKCDPCDIIAGITDDESIADMLCAKYPKISDMCVPSRGLSSTVYLQKFDSLDPRKALELPLEKIPAVEVENLVGAGASKYGVEFVGHKAGNEAHSSRYRLVFDHELSVKTHCFWTAPRRMYLHSLHLDFSGFPDANTYEFIIVPRMGDLYLTGSNKTKSWSIYGPRWIEPGQGVHVNWMASET